MSESWGPESDDEMSPLAWIPGDGPNSHVAPSGLAALELHDATCQPTELSDADLVEAVRAYEQITAWAAAQQARMLAEFARRRPPDRTDPADHGTVEPVSRWVPDEIGLALTLSRGTAADRIERSLRLTHVLPATLAAWNHGQLDQARVRAIHDATLWLSDTAAQVVQDRVLPRAPSQTLAQLRAALARAIIAVDPEGANQRHRKAARQRRVAINPDQDGMASLWALLTAPDALACWGWLTALARGLPADDPRGMDARRADLLVAMLTGNLTIRATGQDGEGQDGEGQDGEGQDGEGQDGEGTRGESATLDTTDNTTGNTTGNTVTGRTDTGAAEHYTAAAGHATTTSGTARDDRTARHSHDGDARDDARDNGAAAAARPAGPVAGSGSAHGSGHRSPPRVPNPEPRTDLPAPVAPTKPLVHVVMPLSTLTGADNSPVDLIGYGPIPPELGRRIAADTVWKRLVTDPLSGTLLDHGRNTYRPPAALADFLLARDQYCRMPICRRRGLDSQRDHTVAFHAQGGTTDEKNLYLGCLCHHRMKDAPGWSVLQESDGRITWTTPTGHRYSSEPFDYRPEPDLAPAVATLDEAARVQAARAAHEAASRPARVMFTDPTPPESPDDPPPF